MKVFLFIISICCALKNSACDSSLEGKNIPVLEGQKQVINENLIKNAKECLKKYTYENCQQIWQDLYKMEKMEKKDWKVSFFCTNEKRELDEEMDQLRSKIACDIKWLLIYGQAPTSKDSRSESDTHTSNVYRRTKALESNIKAIEEYNVKV